MEKLKVLIPTDFSVEAEYAYLMVKKLEEKMDVEIHFLHVMSVPDTVTLNQSGNFETCGDISIKHLEQQKDIADRKLANLKTIYGQNINTHFLAGKLTESILLYSEKESFDLIVMGTKGAWGISEKISGSETQMIARKSKIPLLSLMCDRSDLVIQKILMVHNFDEPIKNDLTLLKKFVFAFQTELHFLQILNNDDESQKEQIELNMKNFAKEHNISNFECHVIKDVDVENGVIHFNQKLNMDLICIGTHGKGGLFHSSATAKLINHLFKPIISFHINN
ncbi:MAG: universal stress protein [Bacteroidota bacterium]|nr:universal stress protein [Bacteroidota bacterium]